MSLSLDPAANPILRIYRLLEERDRLAGDSRRFLSLEQARLAELGGAGARDLVRDLRACAVTFDTCLLCVDGEPIVNFAAGRAENMFEWENIADLTADKRVML